jgi:UDP-glucose 4-epimerase
LLKECTNRDLRVIIASSASVYGSQPSGPIPETADTRPTTNYGYQKLLTEQYADSYFQEADLDVIVLRYFNVFGIHQSTNTYRGVPGKFLDRALTEQQVTVAGDGSQTRDFVHVSDIVDANIRAAAQGSPGSIYNIGSGIATSIHELASIIIEQVSQEVTIETDETVSTGITHSQADISKAEKELDFSPTKSIRTFIEPMRTQIQST